MLILKICSLNVFTNIGTQTLGDIIILTIIQEKVHLNFLWMDYRDVV